MGDMADMALCGILDEMVAVMDEELDHLAAFGRQRDGSRGGPKSRGVIHKGEGTMQAQISKPKPGGRRVIIYGIGGIGKSTWAAAAPSPIFLATEDGLGDVQPAPDMFPVVRTYAEMKHHLTWLAREEHPYKTAVIDSLDWLEL
ncbi:MAG: AAA family ATPase, partial [Pseudomonadota bacterium]